MTLQVEKFREHLEDFAAKHKNEIKKNPQFRKQFQEMCASIGVDPLASGKGKYKYLVLYLEVGRKACLKKIRLHTIVIKPFHCYHIEIIHEGILNFVTDNESDSTLQAL